MQSNVRDQPTDVTPRQARRQFINDKRGRVKNSTVRAYKYPTKNFVEFCEKHGLESMAGISSFHIESWKDARREEVALVTLHNNVKHFRVFIKWCQRREYVDFGLYDKISVPPVPTEKAVSDDSLPLEQAENILRYLQTYEYATRKHAMFFTMWHTGCRISGAISLDVDDLQTNAAGDSILQFRNRKVQGTSLKNGNTSERNVTISDRLAEVLRDYIKIHRDPVTDEYGREPLFTTGSQRLTRNRAYKNVTGVSRPCVSVGTCPHDREIEECPAAQNVESAPSCPSSVSNHPVRRGSITYHLNRGWPIEKLSERVDVGVETLSKHYDARTEEQEREGRREYLDLL